MNSPSKSAIDKLGERLRKAEAPQIADLQLLQEYRAGFRPACDAVAAKVTALFGVEPSQRIKTPNTLIDKLKRDKTRLSSMQDIAGVRIVRDMRLLEQTAMAEEVLSQFPGGRMDDRRERPSFGYRAVHVVAEEQGRRVEVQIRTELQHLWAFTFELMSNLWGRQVRYGGPPDDPERAFHESLPAGPERSRGELAAAALAQAGLAPPTRATIVEVLNTLSTEVEKLERAQDVLASHDSADPEADEATDIEAETRELRTLIRERNTVIRREINVVSQFFHLARGARP